MSQLARKCIASWKEFCPNYEIIEWNENNYDISINKYAKQAYEAKKYAFLSDYARVDILYNNGGIYLDVDVEILKSLDNLLHHQAFAGFESKQKVNLGLGFGAVPNHSLIGLFKKAYGQRIFIKENGKYDYTTVVEFISDILIAKGLSQNNELQEIDGCMIYPTEFFQPININTRKLTITDNTYTIHHYASSWYPPQRKLLQNISKLLGSKITSIVRKILKREIDA